MNLALAQRIGVSAPPTLPRKVANILKKFGSDAHLYTFGPGVPILGPELVVNGDFSNGVTGWSARNATLSVNGGVVQITATAAGYPGLEQMLTGLTPGKSYTLTGMIRKGTCVADAAMAVSGIGASEVANSTTTYKNTSATFTATATSHNIGPYIKAANVGVGETMFSGSVSVKEILGYSNTYSGFVAGNYFDSAGTTHASVDGSVGAVLDAAGSVGAEISPNGYATITNLGGGQYRVEANTTGRLYFDLAQLSNGATYLIEFNVDSFTGSNTFNADWCDVVGGIPTTVLSAGKKSFIASRPTYDSTYRFLDVTVGAGSTVTISGITIKRVTGIHATQSTPGFKPTLRKGIVNLLTHSNDLTNGAYQTQNGATKSGQTLNISSVGASAYHTTVAPAGTNTYAIVVSGSGTIKFWMWGSTDGEKSPLIITLTDTPTLYAISATGIGAMYGFFGNAETTATAVTIGGYGLFTGTLTAAQILAAGGIPLTTTAPASSVAGVNYLEFKAANSTVLQLPSPAFQMADDHCVVVAATYAGGTVTNNVIYSPAADSTASSIKRIGQIAYDATLSRIQGSWYDGTNYDELYFAWPSGSPFVAVTRKVGSTLELWVNGVLRMTKTATATAFTANCGSIGGYPTGGAASYFNGVLHYADAIKGTTTVADVLLQSKLGASIAGIQL